ncbi:multisubunit sodium/proton antiporter, MrpC subunit [Clostridium aceticum]|uniref:Multisubunit sodium/proton antiporter, MrpC subunit n=1 Tax=Clostridium aceticum TaxID=84022 RepID=A0A0D8I9N7_9CLOT|nr:cation:proton antiporter subunit C [Clostridium aceticum]AKL96413.1 multisubunit sodium/proton antiporter, MrpC subunit [Clostridium aceticum]KJF27000.1 hypothetical protein TZ02_10715 [Clostridium aceticum]
MLLFFVGLYGICARRNIIKTIISIEIMQSAVILFFITINFTKGAKPPIGVGPHTHVADPLPQALMLTAIVIGVAVTAVSLTMYIAIYHKYGTTNWQRAMEKRRE